MPITSRHHDSVSGKQRIDFSGLFRTSGRPDVTSPSETCRRRRPRESSPLQFESEFDDMDAREEMSMEAIHFFGLADLPASTPATPKMYDNETMNVKKRQRHFSLEDYNAMDESDDSLSSSTNLSTSNNVACPKRVRQNSIFFPAADDSAASFGSADSSLLLHNSSRRNSDFFSAADLFPDTPTSMSLELDNDHIANQLRAELEVRLLETLCPAAPGSRPGRKFSFELPPQLLSIIASHVIQEAANEPYGLKGCLLHIYYESDTDCEFVASLDCDPDTLATFELTLTLRQDASRRRSWRSKLPELVRSLSSFGVGSVLIGTSYKLVKRRNYRTPATGDDEPEPMLRL